MTVDERSNYAEVCFSLVDVYTSRVSNEGVYRIVPAAEAFLQ